LLFDCQAPLAVAAFVDLIEKFGKSRGFTKIFPNMRERATSGEFFGDCGEDALL
jgi:hypothetical protein